MDFSTLVGIIEEAGYRAYSYSGRNMYGKQCVGFTVDRHIGIFRAIADLIEAAQYIGGEDDGMAVRHMLDIIRSTVTDDMGLDTVVYFPRVRWEGE